MTTLHELAEALLNVDQVLAFNGAKRLVNEEATVDAQGNLTDIWKEYLPKYDALLRTFHLKAVEVELHEEFDILKAVIEVNDEGVPEGYKGFVPLSLNEFLVATFRVVHATTHQQLGFDDALFVARETVHKWFDPETVDKACADLVQLAIAYETA